MKRSLLMLCLALVAAISAVCYAQPKNGRPDQRRASFEEFMAMRTHFFIEEMKLNPADSAKFVVVYQQLLKDKGELMRKYRVGRDVWQKMRSGEALPDSAYTRLVMNEAKMEVEDAQLELKYVEQFSKVLTPKQLFEYRQAEKKFRSNFMRRDHKEAKQDKK